MSKIDDGGPAFPSEHGNVPENVGQHGRANGVSMRDYFAAQAMPQIFHAVGFKAVAKVGGIEGSGIIAIAAYELADAMIEARSL